MIRNRLSELLSERGLKISRVAKEARIARSSLTSMVQNDSEMIRYDAIDKLCKLLNVTPNEFFEYSPIIIEYSFDDYPEVNYELQRDVDDKLVLKHFEFDFLVDVEDSSDKKRFDLEIQFTGFTEDKRTHFKVKDEQKTQSLKEIVDQLSPGLKNVLYKKLQKELQSYVTCFLLNDIVENYDDLSSSDIKRLKQAFEKYPLKLNSNIFTEY